MARKQRLQGLDQVRRVFDRMPEENVKRLANALNQGGEEIAAAAYAAAPVGTPDEHVRDTIEVTEPRVRADGKAVTVFVTAGDTAGTAHAAYRSEFGRKPGGSGKAAEHPGHRAQPFLFPGYFSKRRRVRNRVKREIKRAAKATAALGRQGGPVR